MFESASKILEKFIEIEGRQLWRFDIYSIETVRSNNPSDLYYLCNVRNCWYVVFETEHVFSLKEAADEAKALFEEENFKLKYWLKKKGAKGRRTISFEESEDRATHEELVQRVDNFYLNCAVIKVDSKGQNIVRYDPTAYGSVAE